MTRARLQALIDALVRLRDAADDELALDSIGAYASWKADVEYSADDRREYDGKLYRCVQGHTSQEGWEPDKTPALWTEISVEEWPEWAQPSGAQDAYMIGDKVTYNGQHYISLIDNNTWSPEAYPAGWQLME